MHPLRLFRICSLLLGLLVALAACGYHLEGRRDANTPRKRLYIELFANRTSRAFVNDILTARVVERFARSGLFEIVESPVDADLVLAGSLDRYQTEPVAYSRSDEIAAYRVALDLLATVRRPGTDDGRVFWKGILSDGLDYRADPDRSLQQDVERRAVALICQRLADDLYARVSDELEWTVTPRPVAP